MPTNNTITVVTIEKDM